MLMKSLSPSAYLEHCNSRLLTEGSRADSVLVSPPSAGLKGPILRVVEEELISRHTREILEHGTLRISFAEL
jgi:hypothetical protein